jgi:hypothetical protein
MYTKYPMGNIFTNENQLKEWVDAAKGIKERFGIDKALGYLIGEKFYNLVDILHASRKMVRTIDEERKQPDYNPIYVTTSKNREHVTKLNEIYKEETGIITEAEELLVKFTALIKGAFEPYEIRKYFESNPRLGVHGHISTDEEHDFLVSKGAVEHSVDTEIEDALILGDMMKYFGVS